MPRKTIEVTITAEGRDKGKTFSIEEVSATKADQWAQRALNAMSKVVPGITEYLLAGAMEALASIGFSAFASAPFELVSPLLEELMECVQIKEPAIIRPLTEFDIEEVATRFLLRQEVLELHMGFFKAAVELGRSAAAKAMVASVISSHIQMYRDPSGQSSEQGSQPSTS